MPSTPLIASSMGVATVSAITFGFAPGYSARTTIDGGTTSGYSAIGRMRIAMRPPKKISSDRTPAKIGRSIKNLERFIGSGSWRSVIGEDLAVCRLVACFHHDRLRIDERARTNPLQAVHDDAIAGGESRGHDTQPVPLVAERDFAVHGFVVV